jgi:hypothetical protein
MPTTATGRGFYHKYDGTSWVLLHLSEVGVPMDLPQIASGVEHLLDTVAPVDAIRGARGLPFHDLPGELSYVVPDPALHATGYLEKYSLLNLVKRFILDSALIGDYEGRWLRLNSHYVNGPAFGGLVGTAGGFGKFLQDQLRPTSVLFGEDTREVFYRPEHAADGTPIPMTAGWHIAEADGVRHFYKEGGGGGFHCVMRLYRDRGIGTVVLTNATAFDVRGLLDVLDPRFLE